MGELRTLETPDVDFSKLYDPAQEALVVPVFSAETDRFQQYGKAAITMWGYATKSGLRALLGSDSVQAAYTDCDQDCVLIDSQGTSIRPRPANTSRDFNFNSIQATETSIGLMPVLVVDVNNLVRDGLAAIRMQGFANRLAVSRTLQTGKVTFWSRSRDELWVKGETSGNSLKLRGAYTSARADWLMLDADPGAGPTCHTGRNSCFER